MSDRIQNERGGCLRATGGTLALMAFVWGAAGLMVWHKQEIEAFFSALILPLENYWQCFEGPEFCVYSDGLFWGVLIALFAVGIGLMLLAEAYRRRSNSPPGVSDLPR